ncbi:MAG: PAS domain S-box protein, partial [Thermodesulfovibrionales bacterium]
VSAGIFTGTGIFLSVLGERLKRAQRAETVSVTQEKELALLNMGNLMALDLDHRIVRWSEGSNRLYGYNAQEAQGQLTYELLQTHFVQLRELVQSELLKKGHWEGEVIRRGKDGTQLSVAILWALRRDERGKPLAILEVSTDITRQKLAEESLQQQSEELAQQNEELSRQSEELTQQSEELSEQNEELQTQSEEIQALNAELGQREKTLQTLLDSARLPIGEKEVMEKICHAALEMFGPTAAGAAVYEADDDELRILAHAGFEGADVPRCWPAKGSFVEMVIQQDRTASLEDTSLRPDLNILDVPGYRRFGAVLSSPLHVRGRPIGTVSIYSNGPHRWTVEHFRLIEWLAAQCSNTLKAMRLAADVLKAQKQNEFLANILEASSQAFGVGYPDGRLGLTNKAFEQLTGYNDKELRSIDWSTRLTPPEWFEIERQKLDELHRTGLPVRYEKEYIRKDGTRVPIELLVHMVKDAEGKPLYYYSFLTDITERKRAGEALQKSEERYRNLFNTIDEGFCIIEMIFDTEGRPCDYRFLEVNTSFEKQTGLHEAEGKLMRELAPSHEAHWFEIYGKIALTGEPSRFVNEARALNRWYDVHAYRVGRPEDRHVAVVFNDITELKKAEEIQGHLAAIVDSADDAIIGKDLNGIIHSWNVGAENIFGYKAEEVIGKPISLLVPPGRIDEVPEILVRLKQGEHIESFETERMRKDGTIIPVSLTFSAIKDTAGRIIGASKIAHDITERKRAEEEIKRRTVELEEANRELEGFSYSVSHDLRAPLRHMTGFAELLERRSKSLLDETSLHYVSVISQAAKKLGILIDDLLAFSRIGRSEIQMKRVSLTALVREVVQEMHTEVEGRDIVWKIGELSDVYGDRSMLKLVVANLISNAAKFTRTRPRAEIEIGCREGKDESVFFVEDNGVGFDMNHGDKLFGVFQRLHPQDEFEGTGIGLANVRRIISRHCGRTWAEGSPGEGATFYFTLPKIKEA